MQDITITRALLSVSDKTGIVELAQLLTKNGVEILSTGGTAKLLREHGIAITQVSDHTGYPEMMDGRVKTLNPKIHGGILALRDKDEHVDAMREHDIAPIDLVVVNLYPFEASIADGATGMDAIEQIDIGGPAMIRAAAKNHAHVLVLVDPADYANAIDHLSPGNGRIPFAFSQQMAAKAYARTAAYDSAIARWFTTQEACDSWPPYLLDGKRMQVLRYGENPHQAAAFYARTFTQPGVGGAQQWQGKELSYNNINDADAAWKLVCEFKEPAVAIIKHANPCGVAIADSLTDAYRKALASDPTSAFGGILAVNREVTLDLVGAIGKLFLEVIIAPSIDDSAREALAAKKNLRILTTDGLPQPTAQSDWSVKSVTGGYLVQEVDSQLFDEKALKPATENVPDPEQLRDLRFAFTVCKHVKSNAIVLAKDGAVIGIGAGQMSRVDSVRLACQKAETAGLSTKDTVLASDAFFPFDDNVHHAAQAGVAAIIQPGGSVRDDEVIAAANKHRIAMVMTGIRHFNH